MRPRVPAGEALLRDIWRILDELGVDLKASRVSLSFGVSRGVKLASLRQVLEAPAGRVQLRNAGLASCGSLPVVARVHRRLVARWLLLGLKHRPEVR